VQLIDSDGPPQLISPRKKWIAFVLSLLVAGLGHLYNGSIIMAVFLFLLTYFIPAIAGAAQVLNTFTGLIAVLLIEITFRIGIAIHAAVLAGRQKNYIKKKYNEWYINLCIMVVIVLLSTFVYDTQSLVGVQSFRIPTSGNSPTVMVNDVVMADMTWYKKNKPAYGDIALYNYNNEIYMQRVVGLPGDKIEFRMNHLYINNKSCKQNRIRDLSIDNAFPAYEAVEMLPGGIKHSIWVMTDMPPDARALRGEITVPEKCVFVVGDNRNNSLDSRYIGFIFLENLRGKLLYSFWGQTWDRVGIEF
jgi:signal peptidase I